MIRALVEAAGQKEVTAVIELKARFDEAPNIRLARELEEAGVQVFHGSVGLKTHCKLLLLVRKDDDVIRRYAHLGTGNYNPVTAALYTDLSFMTADESITAAVNDVFNFLTAYAEQPHYRPLFVAPLELADRTLELIAREADHARSGRPAHIIAKMNGLLDRGIIQALYRASQAGVRIELIVRGKNALRPGLRGISSRIRLRSIVGRFLEHSRIFYFANGGLDEVYMGSADWMPRNLFERVEVQFPIKDPALRQRIRHEILGAYLADTRKARILQRDGRYAQPKHAARSFVAQDFLIAVAEGRASQQSLRAVPTPEARAALAARAGLR
jgi:polyphosphate kinase